MPIEKGRKDGDDSAEHGERKAVAPLSQKNAMGSEDISFTVFQLSFWKRFYILAKPFWVRRFKGEEAAAAGAAGAGQGQGQGQGQEQGQKEEEVQEVRLIHSRQPRLVESMAAASDSYLPGHSLLSLSFSSSSSSSSSST
eukprot:767670-Hanusia_phi.AAC.1